MSKHKKPHTDLSAEDKDCLKSLYIQHATVQVDDLPYTEDIKRIHQEFNHARNRALTEGDIHKALKNLGRQVFWQVIKEYPRPNSALFIYLRAWDRYRASRYT